MKKFITILTVALAALCSCTKNYYDIDVFFQQDTTSVTVPNQINFASASQKHYIKFTFNSEAGYPKGITFEGGVYTKGETHPYVVEYSKDGSNWTLCDQSKVQLEDASEGNCIYLRGFLGSNPIYNIQAYDTSFPSTVYIVTKVEGHLGSLINYLYEDLNLCEVSDYQFSHVEFDDSGKAKEIKGLFSHLTRGNDDVWSNGESFGEGRLFANYALDFPTESFVGKYAYAAMFAGCCYQDAEYNSTISVSGLPATDLSEGCYAFMFANCNNLSKSPVSKLPATVLAPYCYEGMFADFVLNEFYPSILNSVPSLSIATLAPYCFKQMFRGCQSLVNISTSYTACTTLSAGCYCRMFQDCKKLSSTIKLPAWHSKYECYYKMFYGSKPPTPGTDNWHYCRDLKTVTVSLLDDEEGGTEYMLANAGFNTCTLYVPSSATFWDTYYPAASNYQETLKGTYGRWYVKRS